MKPLDLIVVSLFLLVAGARAQESIPTLDLTKPLRCKDQLTKRTSISGTVGMLGGTSHGPSPPRVPLDLRLVAVEPLPLRNGSRVTYEVELENVGTVPFLIPWGTKCDVLQYDDLSKFRASVSLILDEYPESSSLAIDLAYGTTDDPRTMSSLAPGGKVRVRLDDTVYFSDYPNELKTQLTYQTQTNIDVRAKLYLSGKPYRKYGFAERKSSNVVAVEIALVQDERQAP